MVNGVPRSSIRIRYGTAGYRSDLAAVVDELLPGKLAGELSATEISGGITNQLIQVHDATGISVLVRIYGIGSEYVIDRSKEAWISVRIGEERLGPAILGFFENGRIEEFFPAHPIKPDQMAQREPVDILLLTSRELAKLHALKIPGLAVTESIWHRVDIYFNLAKKFQFRDAKKKAYDGIDFERIRRMVFECKRLIHGQLHLKTDQKNAIDFISEVVLAHNDLLSGNVLLKDDSSRIFFIDFEYADSNTRAYDIANHWNEYGGFDCKFEKYPSANAQRVFLRKYVEATGSRILDGIDERQLEATLSAMAAVINQYALVSHLFWGLWAIIQAAVSEVQFDYMTYSQQRFDGFTQHCSRFGIGDEAQWQ